MNATFVSKPPIIIKSGLKQLIATPIAKLLFDSTRFKQDDPRLIGFKGKIIAENRGGNYNVSVPYLAIVYSGTLTQPTKFRDLVKPPVSSSVALNNGLPFGIAI